MASENKIGWGFIWSFLDKMLPQLVGIVVSIVLGRLVLPEQHAVIAIAVIFINLGEVFAVYGFGMSIVQKKEITQEDISAVFTINLIVDILIYFCFFFIAPVIAKVYNIEELVLVIRVLSLRIPIAGINSIQKSYNQRELNFRVQFRATIASSIISGIVGIIIAYCGFGVWALVLQSLLNTAICTLLLGIFSNLKLRLVLSVKKVKPFFKYGWKILATSLVIKFYDELRGFIIGKKFSPVDLAYYNKGTQYPVTGTGIINSTVSSVLFPLFARYQDDLEALKQMLRKSVKLSAFVVLPLITGLLIVSEPLIILLLGESWIPAVPYFRISCLACLVLPVQECNLQAVNAVGRSDIPLKNQFPSKIVGLLTILVSLAFDTPFAIAISFVAYSVVSLYINVRPSGELFGYGFLSQMKDIVPTIIKCLTLVVAAIPVYLYIDNSLLEFIVLFVGSVALYVGLSLVTGAEEFGAVIEALKQYLRKK